MPTYISLVTFTQPGATSLKDMPTRLDAAKQGLQSLGGRLTGWYLTMGQYDVVFIFEAPDDAAAAKGLLTLAAQGNVHTQTLRAFSEDEARTLLSGLP